MRFKVGGGAGWRATLSKSLTFILATTAAAFAGDRYHIAQKAMARLPIGEFAEIAKDERAAARDDFQDSARVVPCPNQTSRTMVVALLGQSNAANYAEHRSAAVDPRISVFYHGKCYEARDPLLGATGFRGSVWPTFAKTIVKSGKFDQVVLVPAAIGGTPLVSWAPGGIYWDRVVSRISGLRRAGLKVTHFLIGQGEREANSGEDGVVYKQHAVRLLLALRATGAEVYFATTGQCSGAQNNRIRFAQESARLETGTFAGPDMDLVGPEHRVRGCHLDDFGTRMVALGWANAVINPSG